MEELRGKSFISWKTCDIYLFFHVKKPLWLLPRLLLRSLNGKTVEMAAATAAIPLLILF